MGGCARMAGQCGITLAALVVLSYVLWPGYGVVPAWFGALCWVTYAGLVSNSLVAAWLLRVGRRQDRELRAAATGRAMPSVVLHHPPGSGPPFISLPPGASREAVALANTLTMIIGRSQMMLTGGPVTWVHKTSAEPPSRRVVHADGTPCSPACQARWQS